LTTNAALAIASISVPLLRTDLKCFEDDCYPLAFGVSTGISLIAFILFLIGTPFYFREKKIDKNNKNNKNENIMIKIIKCIYSALKNKIKNGKNIKKQHWLEYADQSFSIELINDIKILLRVMFVFLPLPIFWCIEEQANSKYILQAQRMSGIFGSFTLKPEQFQVITPIFSVILVPFFNYAIYPLFAKIGLLKKQLQRISIGLIFAILSFSVATILEAQIQTRSLQLNPTNRIKLVNLSPCFLNIQTENTIFNLTEAKYRNNQPQFIDANTNLNETIFNFKSNCSQIESEIKINNNNLPFALIFYMNEMNKLDYFIYLYDINNEKVGFSEIKFVSIGIQDTELLNPVLSNNIQTYSKELNLISNNDFNSSNYSNYSVINYSDYDFKIINSTNDEILLNEKILLETCSRYTILFFKTNATLYDYVLLTDIYSSGVHIAFQSIQIFLLSIAQVLVSISGLTFSYEEAPASMKSLMQALWILTTSIGNFIIVIVAEANIGTGLILENIIYIILLVIATVLFFISAHFYKYAHENDKEDSIHWF
jgi:dipeptide/tripeptide permease